MLDRFVLFVLLFPGLALAAPDKDYSRLGGDYSILKDIRLSLKTISFVERRSIVVDNIPLRGAAFSVEARVTIQTQESYVGDGSVFEDLIVRYELVVGEDIENKVHDKLIDDIYSFWTQNPRDNSVLGDKDVTLGERKYVIRSGKHVPSVVWFDGRFVKLNFVSFANSRKSGFGAEQGFWDEKIRFYESGKRIKPLAIVNGRQDRFIEWYRTGKFNR